MFGRRTQVAPVHREQVLAGARVDARLGERRAHLRVPVQAAVHLLQPVASVGDLVVGAEQPARHAARLGQRVAAADAVMPDRELAEHPLHDAVQLARAS